MESVLSLERALEASPLELVEPVEPVLLEQVDLALPLHPFSLERVDQVLEPHALPLQQVEPVLSLEQLQVELVDQALPPEQAEPVLERVSVQPQAVVVEQAEPVLSLERVGQVSLLHEVVLEQADLLALEWQPDMVPQADLQERQPEPVRLEQADLLPLEPQPEAVPLEQAAVLSLAWVDPLEQDEPLLLPHRQCQRTYPRLPSPVPGSRLVSDSCPPSQAGCRAQRDFHPPSQHLNLQSP